MPLPRGAGGWGAVLGPLLDGRASESRCAKLWLSRAIHQCVGEWSCRASLEPPKRQGVCLGQRGTWGRAGGEGNVDKSLLGCIYLESVPRDVRSQMPLGLAVGETKRAVGFAGPAYGPPCLRHLGAFGVRSAPTASGRLPPCVLKVTTCIDLEPLQGAFQVASRPLRGRFEAASRCFEERKHRWSFQVRRAMVLLSADYPQDVALQLHGVVDASDPHAALLSRLVEYFTTDSPAAVLLPSNCALPELAAPALADATELFNAVAADPLALALSPAAQRASDAREGARVLRQLAQPPAPRPPGTAPWSKARFAATIKCLEDVCRQLPRALTAFPDALLPPHAAGRVDYLAHCFSRELVHHNRGLRRIFTDLNALRDGLLGLGPLPPALATLATALLEDRVPDAWHRDLTARHRWLPLRALCAQLCAISECLGHWAAKRRLPTPLRLSHFHDPAALLRGVRAAAPRRHGMPLHTLGLEATLCTERVVTFEDEGLVRVTGLWSIGFALTPDHVMAPAGLDLPAPFPDLLLRPRVCATAPADREAGPYLCPVRLCGGAWDGGEQAQGGEVLLRVPLTLGLGQEGSEWQALGAQLVCDYRPLEDQGSAVTLGDA